MQIVSRLWRDENGFVMTSEAVIIATVLLGLLVGWSAVRIAIVSELADTAAAINGDPDPMEIIKPPTAETGSPF